jgi:hypothetical protein
VGAFGLELHVDNIDNWSFYTLVLNVVADDFDFYK